MSEQIEGASPEECFERWWKESLDVLFKSVYRQEIARMAFLEGGRQQEVRQLAPVVAPIVGGSADNKCTECGNDMILICSRCSLAD